MNALLWIQKLKPVFLIFFISACVSQKDIVTYGHHFQKYQDYKSLAKAVALMRPGITTREVKRILGKPINNGFDYRYLADSTGENHCPVGAVFYIDSAGKIKDWWVDEICE